MRVLALSEVGDESSWQADARRSETERAMDRKVPAETKTAGGGRLLGYESKRGLENNSDKQT